MTDLIKIAIDAMGGDGSPKKIIDGILLNHQSNKNLFYKIFGNESEINKLINNKISKEYYEIINKKIKNIKIAFGGMAEVPKRAINCEKNLNNKNLSLTSFERAKNYLEKDFKPIDDMRATKEYRMEIAKNLLIKCFLEIKSNKLIRLN